MKKFILLIFIFSIFVTVSANTNLLKPYILAGLEKGNKDIIITKVETILNKNEFTILGKYSPMQDSNRTVIIVTHKILTNQVEKFGGLYAFASTLRFGILKKGDMFEISYTNPFYWGNAYFRDKFPEVRDSFSKLSKIITEMFSSLSEVKNIQYGAKKGLKEKKLRKYHYMIFMPYFDDVVKLAKKTEYNSVIKKIETNFEKKLGGVEKVYRLDYPALKLTLYGGALFGKKGESLFIPKIDRTDPRHVTFMPYEFLVMNIK